MTMQQAAWQHRPDVEQIDWKAICEEQEARHGQTLPDDGLGAARGIRTALLVEAVVVAVLWLLYELASTVTH